MREIRARKHVRANYVMLDHGWLGFVVFVFSFGLVKRAEIGCGSCNKPYKVLFTGNRAGAYCSECDCGSYGVLEDVLIS